MKKVIILAVLFPLWGLGGLYAQVTIIDQGSCGNSLTWVLTSDSTLTISGSDTMPDYSGGTPWEAYKSSIAAVIIGDSVTTIGNSAFYGCKNLASVNIPNSVTSIGNSAFGYCVKLTSIAIPNNVTRIGNSAFSECRSLSSVSIGNNVTSIEHDAFFRCVELTSITIPNSVTSIGSYAFLFCENLKYVTLSNSMTRIELGTFMGCTRLTSITIPNSVTYIDCNAFCGCIGLKYITNHAIIPPVLGNTAFRDVPDTVPVYTPCGMRTAYQNSSWSGAFTNFIENCRGGRISGYVRHEQDHKSLLQKAVGDPAADVNVHLQQGQNSSWTTIAQMLTDTEGYFEFNDISAGRYRVVLEIDGLEHIEDPQIVVINEGDTITDIEYEITEDGIKNKSGNETGVVQLTVSDEQLTVYPNPVKNQLTIKDGELKINNIELFDVYGKSVLRHCEQSEAIQKIDVSDFANGIYILKINTNQGIITRKIVKQ